MKNRSGQISLCWRSKVLSVKIDDEATTIIDIYVSK
jgi:hypothetical protein